MINDHETSLAIPLEISIPQSFSQTIYDLNSELLVCYLSHDLNNEPFNEQTILDHLNTELVCYSDPHCILKCNTIKD